MSRRTSTAKFTFDIDSKNKIAHNGKYMGDADRSNLSHDENGRTKYTQTAWALNPACSEVLLSFYRNHQEVASQSLSIDPMKPKLKRPLQDQGAPAAYKACKHHKALSTTRKPQRKLSS